MGRSCLFGPGEFSFDNFPVDHLARVWRERGR